MLESKSEIVAALNMIMGHHPKTDDQVVSVGANRHYSLRQDTMESFNLGGGLSVLRGFFVSVRAATARVLLNVQVKYLACYNEGPLVNVIQGYGNRNTYRLEKFLKSLRVRITHITRKNSRGPGLASGLSMAWPTAVMVARPLMHPRFPGTALVPKMCNSS